MLKRDPKSARRRLVGAALAAGAVWAAEAALASQRFELASGPIPVGQAFELKKVMGVSAFAAEVDAAIAQVQERAESTGNCATPAETAAAAQLELVRRTSNPQVWARTRAASDAALAQRRELRALYLGGAKAPPPYGLVSQMAARAKAEPNSRLAELYRRMAEDQFSRIDSVTLRPFFGPGVHTAWETGLDDAALAYVATIIESEWCPMDVANTAWLKADLKAHGWYIISTYGADADRAVWSMVQHARHDLAFQEEVLAMLEPLWQSGETTGQNYAMLYDQTAHLTGRPDRFGVDGECTAPGVWTPASQEDPRATDKWRSKAGMPPLAEYVATRSRGCTD
jgi:hypothetical protein